MFKHPPSQNDFVFVCLVTIVIGAIVFPIAWFSAFFALYFFVFGDRGGRFQAFAYPIAFIVTSVALQLLWHYQVGPLTSQFLVAFYAIVGTLVICMTIAAAIYAF